MFFAILSYLTTLMRPRSNRYKFAGKISGLKKPVHSLAVNSNGRLLAGGGGDGLRVWNVRSLNQLPVPLYSTIQRGDICSVLWVTKLNDAREIICCGTALGYVVIWTQYTDPFQGFEEVRSQRMHGGHEITSMSRNQSLDNEIQILLSTNAGTVQLVVIDTNSNIVPLWSVKLENVVPSVVRFSENDEDSDVLVFGFNDGNVYTIKGSSAALVATRNLMPGIGHADISYRNREYVIDNGEGFSIHHLRSGGLIREFPYSKPTTRWPKQVAYGENDRIIVGGSDHGLVYVYDRQIGYPLDLLRHSDGGWVQTVATHSSKRHHTVVSATSSESNTDDISICIWEYEEKRMSKRKMKKSITFGNVLVVLAQLFLLACTSIFLFQNKEAISEASSPWLNDFWYNNEYLRRGRENLEQLRKSSETEPFKSEQGDLRIAEVTRLQLESQPEMPMKRRRTRAHPRSRTVDFVLL